MGNRVENILSIPKTGFTDKKDESRTKLTSISFYFLRTLHWISYDFFMLIFQGFQDNSNYILFAHIHLEIRALYPSQFSEL